MCWLPHAALWRVCPSFLLLILAVCGAVQCFAGYRAWSLIRALNGAALGTLAGLFLGMLSGNPAVAVGAILAGLGAGAALFIAVPVVGTFLCTFTIGASFMFLLVSLHDLPHNFGVALLLASGVAAALVGVFAGRPALIALTALSGAYYLLGAASTFCATLGFTSSTASATLSLTPDAPLTPLADITAPTGLLAFLALVAAGLFTQFTTPSPPTNPDGG